MILTILIIYLVCNAIIGIWYNRKKSQESTLSVEKKYYIGSRSMNGLLLAMTTMATYTSVSSFVSGPGAAGMTYGYAQVWIAAVQVPALYRLMVLVNRRKVVVLVH